MRFVKHNKGPENKGPERPPPVEHPHTRTRVFNWLAPIYDLSMWLLCLPFGGEERLRKKVLREISPLQGAKVLELFCGTATFSIMAVRQGARATGLDLSPGMLDVARLKSQKEGLTLALVNADSVSLPFVEKAFDRVLISLGLHETTEGDRELVLKEVFRVLKEGGRAVIFDYHRAGGIAGLVQKLGFFFIEEETVHTWVRTDVQGLLREVGFKDFRRTYLFSRSFQIITVKR
jgi:demethylmenaquinone methyltransferase/2-methoxy-6-polyprenyl-1,4-benzoquinol methylase